MKNWKFLACCIFSILFAGYTTALICQIGGALGHPTEKYPFYGLGFTAARIQTSFDGPVTYQIQVRNNASELLCPVINGSIAAPNPGVLAYNADDSCAWNEASADAYNIIVTAVPLLSPPGTPGVTCIEKNAIILGNTYEYFAVSDVKIIRANENCALAENLTSFFENELVDICFDLANYYSQDLQGDVTATFISADTGETENLAIPPISLSFPKQQSTTAFFDNVNVSSLGSGSYNVELEVTPTPPFPGVFDPTEEENLEDNSSNKFFSLLGTSNNAIIIPETNPFLIALIAFAVVFVVRQKN